MASKYKDWEYWVFWFHGRYGFLPTKLWVDRPLYDAMKAEALFARSLIGVDGGYFPPAPLANIAIRGVPVFVRSNHG